MRILNEIFESILNLFLPLRSDFEIVKNLTEEKILNLPKAEQVLDENWITPLFKYKDRKVKAIIWELKYKENILPLETIGKMIYEEIISEIADVLLFNATAEFLLLPIPLTEKTKAGVS